MVNLYCYIHSGFLLTTPTSSLFLNPESLFHIYLLAVFGDLSQSDKLRNTAGLRAEGAED